MTRLLEPECVLCGHPVKLDLSHWTHVEEARDSGHIPIVADAAVPTVEDPETRRMGTRRPIRG